MSIAIESRGIADVRPAGAPHGIPGIGFGRLQFPIEFQLHGCPSPAVRHFSHLAAHVDQQGAPETFSRQDALFILTAAAEVLWDATSRIGGSSSSRNPGPP